MTATFDRLGLDVFATCPPSTAVEGPRYLACVADVAAWSERHGCVGVLVYTDGRLVDPWCVAQVILQRTDRLAPLVAVQPVYMHPYTTARMVASLGHLYGRRVDLNLVAGGFTGDLLALGDRTPHDRRYDRLTEYGLIVMHLLADAGPFSLAGEFYQVERLRLRPTVAPDLVPRLLVSGSSAAGLAAARALGAVAVEYPEPGPASPAPPAATGVLRGVRLGVIARSGDDEAWRVARARFPESRRGELTHQLAMKASDSAWHAQLSRAGEAAVEAGPWWLHPFRTYQTFCPYLVGAYERVAQELAEFVAAGRRTFILDVPLDDEELHHTRVAFASAMAAAARVGAMP